MKPGHGYKTGSSYLRGQMVKRLSDMLPMEAGTLVRVERPEDVMALVEMGCCLGERIEVAHMAAAGGPIAILSAGRKLALRRNAAEGLWLEVQEGSDDLEDKPRGAVR